MLVNRSQNNLEVLPQSPGVVTSVKLTKKQSYIDPVYTPLLTWRVTLETILSLYRANGLCVIGPIFILRAE